MRISVKHLPYTIRKLSGHLSSDQGRKSVQPSFNNCIELRMRICRTRISVKHLPYTFIKKIKPLCGSFWFFSPIRRSLSRLFSFITIDDESERFFIRTSSHISYNTLLCNYVISSDWLNFWPKRPRFFAFINYGCGDNWRIWTCRILYSNLISYFKCTYTFV